MLLEEQRRVEDDELRLGHDGQLEAHPVGVLAFLLVEFGVVALQETVVQRDTAGRLEDTGKRLQQFGAGLGRLDHLEALFLGLAARIDLGGGDGLGRSLGAGHDAKLVVVGRSERAERLSDCVGFQSKEPLRVLLFEPESNGILGLGLRDSARLRGLGGRDVERTARLGEAVEGIITSSHVQFLSVQGRQNS